MPVLIVEVGLEVLVVDDGTGDLYCSWDAMVGRFVARQFCR